MKINPLRLNQPFVGGRVLVKSNGGIKEFDVNDTRADYLSKRNLAINQREAEGIAETMQKLPGEDNILDLTHNRPIIKLEDESHAYFVKAVDGNIAEKQGEVINWIV